MTSHGLAEWPSSRPSSEAEPSIGGMAQIGSIRFIATVATTNAHKMMRSGSWRPTLCSPSRKYVAKLTAASSAMITPSPSNVSPFHTRLTTASPTTARPTASHIRPRTGSLRTKRTQSTTSTGARYSISSAMPSGSRSIATL